MSSLSDLRCLLFIVQSLHLQVFQFQDFFEISFEDAALSYWNYFVIQSQLMIDPKIEVDFPPFPFHLLNHMSICEITLLVVSFSSTAIVKYEIQLEVQTKIWEKFVAQKFLIFKLDISAFSLRKVSSRLLLCFSLPFEWLIRLKKCFLAYGVGQAKTMKERRKEKSFRIFLQKLIKWEPRRINRKQDERVNQVKRCPPALKKSWLC